MLETHLQQQVYQYLTMRYPEVIFKFAADGLGMSKLQAYKAKRTGLLTKGFPDLFIARRVVLHEDTTPQLGHHASIANPPYFEPQRFWSGKSLSFCGMFLELKTDVSVVLKKDGTLKKNEHLENQVEMMNRLRLEGYFADFAFGFDDAVNKITWYMTGEPFETCYPIPGRAQNAPGSDF